MRKFVFLLLLLPLLTALACRTLAPGETETAPTIAPVLTAPAETELPPGDAPTTGPAAGPSPTVDLPPQATLPVVVPTLAGVPSVPTIVSFTANPATLAQGQEVELSWQASGGTEASICWVSHEAILTCAPGPLDPNGGTAAVRPTAPGRPGATEMMLVVKNSAGPAEARVRITIECAESPMPELEGQRRFGNCPYNTVVSNAAYEPFERGHMIWLGGNRTIYVLYADGRFEAYTDNFREGDPESDPAIIPPTGLYQPIRGFGLVWRTNPNVRTGLGWATAPESAFQGWSQSYTGTGMHNAGTFIRFFDGSVRLLNHMGGQWEVFNP